MQDRDAYVDIVRRVIEQRQHAIEQKVDNQLRQLQAVHLIRAIECVCHRNNLGWLVNLELQQRQVSNNTRLKSKDSKGTSHD